MNRLRNAIGVIMLCIATAGCVDTPKHEDTLSSGTIDISADETYRQVIEAEQKVFDSSFPNAHVNIHYKPEAECFKDYFANKARIILVTRDLTPEEKERTKQDKFFASSVPLAKDAVVTIVNNANDDSLMSVQQVKGILTGTYKKKYTVVFDNQGGSLVRYIKDSVLRTEALGSNVFAAKGDTGVISYVMNNPNAVGFLGLTAAVDSNDVTNTGEFIKNVRVVGFYNDTMKQFYKPYLGYLGLKIYP
ncbi:MAG: hypothetical protein EBZ77_09260, partial [Chitinophagia bacterium]|nr:hypothetical protein [Chitinophagia bacterium]